MHLALTSNPGAVYVMNAVPVARMQCSSRSRHHPSDWCVQLAAVCGIVRCKMILRNPSSAGGVTASTLQSSWACWPRCTPGATALLAKRYETPSPLARSFACSCRRPSPLANGTAPDRTSSRLISCTTGDELRSTKCSPLFPSLHLMLCIF